MRPAYRLSIAAAILLGTLGGASAQYYGDDYYDGPPPRRGGYAYRYEERRLPPPPPHRISGLNCDAVRPGLLGAHPFSCPLPGPRPLGARCFCDTPVAPLSGGETVAGRVVP